MRPVHAKDPVATAPPGAAGPAGSLSHATAADDGEGHRVRERLPLPAGSAEVRRIDADVPGAVGRVLGHVLAERLRGARLADPLFAGELAERVARFTLQGGKRTRARLVWWAARACAGRDPGPAAAALRIGVPSNCSRRARSSTTT